MTTTKASELSPSANLTRPVSRPGSPVVDSLAVNLEALVQSSQSCEDLQQRSLRSSDERIDAGNEGQTGEPAGTEASFAFDKMSAEKAANSDQIRTDAIASNPLVAPSNLVESHTVAAAAVESDGKKTLGNKNSLPPSAPMQTADKGFKSKFHFFLKGGSTAKEAAAIDNKHLEAADNVAEEESGMEVPELDRSLSKYVLFRRATAPGPLSANVNAESPSARVATPDPVRSKSPTFLRDSILPALKSRSRTVNGRMTGGESRGRLRGASKEKRVSTVDKMKLIFGRAKSPELAGTDCKNQGNAVAAVVQNEQPNNSNNILANAPIIMKSKSDIASALKTVNEDIEATIVLPVAAEPLNPVTYTPPPIDKQKSKQKRKSMFVRNSEAPEEKVKEFITTGAKETDPLAYLPPPVEKQKSKSKRMSLFLRATEQEIKSDIVEKDSITYTPPPVEKQKSKLKRMSLFVRAPEPREEESQQVVEVAKTENAIPYLPPTLEKQKSRLKRLSLFVRPAEPIASNTKNDTNRSDSASAFFQKLRQTSPGISGSPKLIELPEAIMVKFVSPNGTMIKPEVESVPVQPKDIATDQKGTPYEQAVAALLHGVAKTGIEPKEFINSLDIYEAEALSAPISVDANLNALAESTPICEFMKTIVEQVVDRSVEESGKAAAIASKTSTDVVIKEIVIQNDINVDSNIRNLQNAPSAKIIDTTEISLSSNLIESDSALSPLALQTPRSTYADALIVNNPSASIFDSSLVVKTVESFIADYSAAVEKDTELPRDAKLNEIAAVEPEKATVEAVSENRTISETLFSPEADATLVESSPLKDAMPAMQRSDTVSSSITEKTVTASDDSNGSKKSANRKSIQSKKTESENRPKYQIPLNDGPQALPVQDPAAITSPNAPLYPGMPFGYYMLPGMVPEIPSPIPGTPQNSPGSPPGSPEYLIQHQQMAMYYQQMQYYQQLYAQHAISQVNARSSRNFNRLSTISVDSISMHRRMSRSISGDKRMSRAMSGDFSDIGSVYGVHPDDTMSTYGAESSVDSEWARVFSTRPTFKNQKRNQWTPKRKSEVGQHLIALRAYAKKYHRGDPQRNKALIQFARFCIQDTLALETVDRNTVLNEAFEILKKLSFEGSGEAQYILGKGYRNDDNLDSAYILLYNAANQSFGPACALLAEMVLEKEISESEAMNPIILYMKGVRAGSSECAFKLGCIYSRGKYGNNVDFSEASKLLNECVKGTKSEYRAKALFEIAYIYETGSDGFPKNESIALSALNDSAKHGCIAAIRKMAECYLEGKLGLKQDIKKAASFFKTAADAGDETAKSTLQILKGL